MSEVFEAAEAQALTSANATKSASRSLTGRTTAATALIADSWFSALAAIARPVTLTFRRIAVLREHNQ